MTTIWPRYRRAYLSLHKDHDISLECAQVDDLYYFIGFEFYVKVVKFELLWSYTVQSSQEDTWITNKETIALKL